MPEIQTREPIISVLGHVDHGKTTLLDWIRGSVVASREAGGITQHIGATDVPFYVIRKICGNLLEPESTTKSLISSIEPKGSAGKLKLKIQIRGLLFIDTPGHEAFTNLRRRGGSVADIAILVVDINEGVMPQTVEAIQILRHYKTPFVVAANKIDVIHGFRSGIGIENQMNHVKDEFYKKFYSLVWQLSEQNFDSDLFSNINDFTKYIAIVPISAKTGMGIPELLMILLGLTQQYLAKQLTVGMDSPAKGTILEVKEERGLGTTIDVIIYDGIIKRGDMIVVGARDPIVTKVKALLRPKPLDEMRDPREKFKNVEQVYAASGVKIAAPNLEDAMAGAPVYVGGSELIEQVKKEIENVEIHTDSVGVIVKADTIGSLEAIVKILTDSGIPIRNGTIGKVSNTDVIEASAVGLDNKYLGIILSFNSGVLRDAEILARDKGIVIFKNNVIYKLIEDYNNWIAKEKERERDRILGLVVMPAKMKLLKGCVFRQSKPAIVGVEILGGTIAPGYRLMRDDGKVVGKIREIQKANEQVKSAKKGEQVAVSIDDVIIGRNLNEEDTVYSFVSDEDMQKINKEELSSEELQILKEIIEIKKKRISVVD